MGLLITSGGCNWAGMRRKACNRIFNVSIPLFVKFPADCVKGFADV